MPQILSDLQLDEVSLVDRPANSTVDGKGKKTARAVIALYKRDTGSETSKAAKGIKFVVGFKGGKGSQVQSVIFDKDQWDADAARKWLADHDMKSGTPDTTSNTLRFRQLDPGGFDRFRVIEPGQQKGIHIAAKGVEVAKDVTVESDKHDYGPGDKELWKAVNGDPDATLAKDGTCQTQGGKCFPASDYAYVPDQATPSTWKLRLTSTPGGKPDPGIVGAAAAALGPGFRGKKVQLPSSARAAVTARIRAAWRDANPDRDSGEMPDALQKVDQGEPMTLEELELRVTKQDETIAVLKERNQSLDTENALVIKMTKSERKLYASMDDDARKSYMAADTQKRGNMMEEAKRKRREKKLTDSMDEACKAEFAVAGPIQKAAMLEEQEVKLEKARKRRKGQSDNQDSADGSDDGSDDGDDEDGEDDGDGNGGNGGDDSKDRRKALQKRLADRRQLAAYEDRIAKSEAELDLIRKRERAGHFVKRAEAELPNTPGSPADKGQMLQKLADTFGEESADFKKLLGDLKNADKLLAEQYSEIGKAARGNIPSLAAFDAKVEEISKRDRIDKPHAVAKALEEAPELYLDYEREQRQIVARA